MFESCTNGAIDTGDTAFLAFCTTMVFLQCTAGIAITQAGMIRRKNSLSMVTQVLIGTAIGALTYFMIGFTISFGPSYDGFIGNLDYAFLAELPLLDCFDRHITSARTVPAILVFAFQMSFYSLTPLVVSGAWAERLNFKAFLVFICTWPILVYAIVACWVWNVDGFLAKNGVLDFAGGLVVHLNAGTAGLIVSIALQGRYKSKKIVNQSHNLVIASLGACIVLVAWYSFDAGCANGANNQAVLSLTNTHLAACSGAILWLTLSYFETGKFSLLNCLNGFFAGLACQTPGSGYIEPWAAIVFGMTGTFAAYTIGPKLKVLLNMDDVLDCVSLQAIPGAIGVILVGFFATSEAFVDGEGTNGVFYGGSWSFLGWQILAVIIVFVWGAFWTSVIVFGMSNFLVVNVTPEEEEMGLDKSQIGEQAYDEELSIFKDLGEDTITQMLCSACSLGNLKEVKRLCHSGADPSLVDYDGRSPLHLAAAEGRLDVVQYLHDFHKVNLNVTDRWGGTPMTDAFVQRRSIVIKWLRSHGGTFGDMSALKASLFYAAADGQVNEVQRIMETGLDVNAADYDFRTALHLACAEGHAEVVDFLVQHGANVNAQDRWQQTPVTDAVKGHHNNIVSLLRTRGSTASTRSTNDELSSAGLSMKTPLLLSTDDNYGTTKTSDDDDNVVRLPKESFSMSASTRDLCTMSAEGSLDEVKKLVRKGAIADSCDYDGRTPLMIAAANGHLSLVIYFVDELDINVNATDRFNSTALTEAVANSHADIAAYLRSMGSVVINRKLGYDICDAASKGEVAKLEKFVHAGLNLGVADYDSRTGMHLAACNGHSNVIEFLASHGCDLSPKDRYGNTPLVDAKRHGQEAAETAITRLTSATEGSRHGESRGVKKKV